MARPQSSLARPQPASRYPRPARGQPRPATANQRSAKTLKLGLGSHDRPKFYNAFLLFLGSSAAPDPSLLFHFVPTAAAISCPWSTGQVAAAASPGTAVFAAATVRSVRGAVLSLLCRLEFTALTTDQLCFVLWFLVTNTFYFLAVAPAISVL